MRPKIVTIGVYGSTEESFFKALQDAHVDAFCDVRQRRAVRGSLYTYANSARLQKHLADMDIRYIHAKDLAPSTEMRELQYRQDKKEGVGKRSREVLAKSYVAAYEAERLANFNSADFMEKVIGPGAKVIALFCVEREAAACHRSLVAQKLAHDLGLEVEHIKP